MEDLMEFVNQEYGKVRVISINGDPWFVGKDLATALGYSNSRDAIIRHVSKEDRDVLRRSSDATFYIPPRGFIIVNESGFYSLVLSSRLETAIQFRDWVTSEVLPSIRKTGKFSIEDAPNEQMEIIRKNFAILEDEIKSVRESLAEFKMGMPLLPADQKKITGEKQKRASECMGKAFGDKHTRRRIYCDIDGRIYDEFDVRAYRDLAHSQLEQVIKLIDEYVPSDTLIQAIMDVNSDGIDVDITIE